MDERLACKAFAVGGLQRYTVYAFHPDKKNPCFGDEVLSTKNTKAGIMKIFLFRTAWQWP